MPMLIQVEAYYFFSAAGHKRILGNRRFGENGFISSGRMQARPVAQSSRGGSKVETCLLFCKYAPMQMSSNAETHCPGEKGGSTPDRMSPRMVDSMP